MGRLGLGDDHQPARVLVETMHNPRPSNPTDSGQAGAAMAEEGVDEGAGRVSRRRVDNQPCGLVDHDQMCILKADIERHRLPSRRWIFILGENYDEILAAADPQRRVPQRRPFARDAAGFDQPFEPRPRQRRQTDGKRTIEALPGLPSLGTNGGRSDTGSASCSCHDRAFLSYDQPDRSSLKRMRALKIIVVVMGVMLIGGFAILVAVIASRLGRGGNTARSFAATTIDIPHDARIEAMTAGTDRLVLDLVLPEGQRQLVVIDLGTGTRLGTIDLHTAP